MEPIDAIPAQPARRGAIHRDCRTFMALFRENVRLSRGTASDEGARSASPK
jgi:hypothetical protein